MHLQSTREVARLLGGEAHGSRIRCPGPGHSKADRSLEVWFRHDAPEGFVANSFACDDWQACRDYVRERLGLPDRREAPWLYAKPASHRPKPAPDASPDQATRIARAGAIWREAMELRGTIAERYLLSRGLKSEESLGHVLRFSPMLAVGKQTAGPAMVALFRDIITNEPCGVHRTFLDGAGRKLDRKMLGRAKGAAIKLDAHEDVVAGLHLGEGIETGLAARQLGYRPTWALGSAGAVACFPVLAGIEAIGVLVENDQASQRAADACCERYELAGCEAWIIEPPAGDINDTLRAA